jgi:hypothetical protein
VSGEKKKDYEVGYGAAGCDTVQKRPIRQSERAIEKDCSEPQPWKSSAIHRQRRNRRQDRWQTQTHAEGRNFLPAVVYRSNQGDLPAARLISKMAKEYFGPEAEGPSETKFVIVPDEASYATSRGPTQAKRQVSPGSLFRKVAKEQIGIEIDDVTVTMSRWDAYVRQIYTMALNKNNGAARLLDQLRRQFPATYLLVMGLRL